MQLFVRGLKLFAHHGVTDEERREGREYLFDLRVTLRSESASRTDDVRDTLDYGKLVELIARISGGQNFRTVERLAGEIVKNLFARFERIDALDLSVSKLAPPTQPVVGEAGVRMIVSRTEHEASSSQSRQTSESS